MALGIFLIVTGAICMIRSISKGDDAAGDGNIAGIIWHGFFAFAGASALLTGIRMVGWV